ncbi:MAG: AarF/ABC1/UbiB kinase family protein, partial [Ilumatobacteraceae bacterium]
MENLTGRPADREWAAFSDTPPWLLTRATTEWLPLVDDIRVRARAELPSLMIPPRITPVRRLVVVVARVGWALGPWLLRKRRG